MSPCSRDHIMIRMSRISGVWSLRVPDICLAFPADCLHPPRCHQYSLVAWDPQVSQHMAGCAPYRCRHGGQRIYLRTVRYVATHYLGGGIGYPLCVSPRSSDCIISADLGVRRAVSEGSRHIAWPSLLITCTHHIVTDAFFAGSEGYSGFPAYSRILIT